MVVVLVLGCVHKRTRTAHANARPHAHCTQHARTHTRTALTSKHTRMHTQTRTCTTPPACRYVADEGKKGATEQLCSEALEEVSSRYEAVAEQVERIRLQSLPGN